MTKLFGAQVKISGWWSSRNCAISTPAGIPNRERVAHGGRPGMNSRFGLVLGGEVGKVDGSMRRFWSPFDFSIQKDVWELRSQG